MESLPLLTIAHITQRQAAAWVINAGILTVFHDYIEKVDKTYSDIDSFENIPFVLKCGN